MKKLLGILITVMVAGFIASNTFAATTLTQSATVSVASILSAEFANTVDSTFGSGTIPWTAVSATSNLVYATGHVTTKCDVGIIGIYNGAGAWYLKLGFASANGLAGKMKFYLPQPINRNTSLATNGTLAQAVPAPGADWPVIAGTAATVYTSGSNDSNNTPFGTFCAFSYGLNPIGLTAGTAYSGTITYTITTTP